MKSDIYTEKDGIERILSEIERVGKFCELPQSAIDKLRLLAEEMLGLTVRLFENLEYEFFIEKAGWRKFTLNLSANTLVSRNQKEKLLSLSSTGKNKAAEGVMGKISEIFESLILDSQESIVMQYPQIIAPHYEGMGLATYFSLAAYTDDIHEKKKEEHWDGLEKSIIATLAKDMVIGVRNKKAEMIAFIEF